MEFSKQKVKRCSNCRLKSGFLMQERWILQKMHSDRQKWSQEKCLNTGIQRRFIFRERKISWNSRWISCIHIKKKEKWSWNLQFQSWRSVSLCRKKQEKNWFRSRRLCHCFRISWKNRKKDWQELQGEVLIINFSSFMIFQKSIQRNFWKKKSNCSIRQGDCQKRWQTVSVRKIFLRF